MLEKWKKVWEDNYNGVSLESKALQGYLTSNYKGNNYLPWQCY